MGQTPNRNPACRTCKNILHVQRKTPSNACRAELGQDPSLINIQKRAVKFWIHLKNSDPHSYHYKALKYQEMSSKKSPLSQLVLRLSALTPTKTKQPQDCTSQTIRVNQIIEKHKQNYITHWDAQTKTQSKFECYRALKREYTVADYLTTVKQLKTLKILTKYRLSEHNLAIETGRHRQTWLPREGRLCSLCDTQGVEIELHFLTILFELNCESERGQKEREGERERVREGRERLWALNGRVINADTSRKKRGSAAVAVSAVATCIRRMDILPRHTHTHTHTHTHY